MSCPECKSEAINTASGEIIAANESLPIGEQESCLDENQCESCGFAFLTYS